MAIQVMRATEDDLPEIASLLASNDLPTADLASLTLSDFLLARDGRGMAGVIGLQRFGNDALLRSLAVQSSYRRDGIGTKLVQESERQAKEMGVSCLYLLTMSASGFFKEKGYREIERAEAPAAIQSTEQFKSLCPSQAVCMTRSLT